MWARVVEFMLGCWLAVSPFVFRYGPDDSSQLMMDFALATAIATLSLLSYWHPTRHAHLLTSLVALGMIGYGRFATPVPIPPNLQNYILVGLLLLMFAIVPNYASQPPRTGYRHSTSDAPEQAL